MIRKIAALKRQTNNRIDQCERYVHFFLVYLIQFIFMELESNISVQWRKV